jgi:hypothetical protein
MAVNELLDAAGNFHRLYAIWRWESKNRLSKTEYKREPGIRIG